MSDEPPFRAIAESTYDWETWVDGNGEVRWVNRAVERFIGVSATECLAIDSFPMPFVDAADREIVAAVLSRAARGESGNDIEFRIEPRDGTTRWVSISFQPLVDDDGIAAGYRTSIRDIALRKEAERRIAEAERDAARLAAERTNLLATLSHELRSPLHCIAGFADLLLDSDLDAKQRRFVDLVADQSTGALRLVEDLLRFAAGPGRGSPRRDEAFDLAALVSLQIDSLRARARDGVSVRFESRLGAHPVRLGDPDRIRQIVANLLGNALRFTERGHVAVELDEDAHEDEVVLGVIDTGVGMNEETIARARTPFFQAESASERSRGGVGLGLAIVDELAAGLGGRLELASEPGEGTRAIVRIRLPRATMPVESVADDASTRPVPAIDVLVVDDVDASRELIAAMLDSVGIAARLAASGMEAIAACAASMPDLVLLDFHMPGLDGAETARRIAALVGPGTTPPRIVMLTANVLAETVRPHVDAWLTKPLRRTALLSLLTESRTVGSESERVDSRNDPAIDAEVLDELASIVDASGASILARSGPKLIDALVAATDRVRSTTDAEASSRYAHELRGIAATLGARGMERLAGRIEDEPSDLAAIAALVRLVDPTIEEIRRRIDALTPGSA